MKTNKFIQLCEKKAKVKTFCINDTSKKKEADFIRNKMSKSLNQMFSLNMAYFQKVVKV